jgi:hypothetical protein
MKNGVCLDITPCGSCKNRYFGGEYRLHHQGDNRRATNNAAKKYNVSMFRLLFTAHVVPISQTLDILMMEAIRSSET